MAFKLTQSLREEYQRLFDTCDIRPERLGEVGKLTTSILNNRPRYEAVGRDLKVPWFFIGVVHCLESSFSFNKHLHNGDPLTARTKQVPKGRPLVWNPPNDWESSARDALSMEGLHKVTDWSIPGTLFLLEKYNGLGYRRFHPEVLSPYLWSFSTHYTEGKYASDGTFDPDLVSKQCGSAVLLRRMAETGAISFDTAGNPLTESAVSEETPEDAAEPLVTFSETEVSEEAKKLQRALNTLPGVFLLVDGIPGRKTSDAFRKATGHLLKGDPRNV